MLNKIVLFVLALVLYSTNVHAFFDEYGAAVTPGDKDKDRIVTINPENGDAQIFEEIPIETSKVLILWSCSSNHHGYTDGFIFNSDSWDQCKHPRYKSFKDIKGEIIKIIRKTKYNDLIFEVYIK